MSKERFKIIMASLCAFSPTLQGGGETGWTSQRDKTQLVSEFERTAFMISKRLFSVPAFQFLTLDDELMGTRSHSNPVKSISIRKADREGQSADVIADSLFRFTIDSRLHRRGEGRIESVRQLLKNVQEGRGELSTRSTIFTADRGYSSPAFMKEMSSFGYSCILIMPEHLLSVHPFVSLSHLDGVNADLIANDNEARNHGDEEAQCEDGPETTVEGTVGSFPASLRKFIVDDNGKLGPAIYSAKKVGVCDRNAKTKAYAVREPCKGTLANVLRFQLDMPTEMSTTITHWVYCKHGTRLTSDIFHAGTDDNLRNETRRALLQNCHALTRGQRCADWFILRRFRVTATVASKVLLHDNGIRLSLIHI